MKSQDPAAYLDEARGFVFTGDAIGSGEGVWIQVDTALPLRAYQRGLRAFLTRLSACGDLTFCGCHIGQCGRPYTAKFNPLTIQTVRDMIALIDEIVAGRAYRRPFSLPGRSWPEQPYIARLGAAAMVYRESGARDEA